MKTRAVHFLAVSLAFVGGCGEPPAPTRPPPKVPVVEVITRDVPIYSEAVGETLGSLDISVRARVAGTVEAVHFKEGSSVKKGDPLYRIDPAPFEAKVREAEGKLAEANARYVRADSDLKRVRPLVEIDALSRRTLDSAVAEFDAAKGLVEAAEAMVKSAEIDLGYTEIKAPISGLIGVSEAYQGDFVGQYPNPIVLTTVSQLDPIKVRFSVAERDYVEYVQTHGAPPALRGESDPKDKAMDLTLFLVGGYEHPYKGEIGFAGREITAETGTLMIEAEFPNPEKTVRPGQFARVRATIKIVKDGTLVPQKAVVELQGTYQLFVIGDGDKAEIRQVKPGVRVGELWLIEEGVKAGERVVVSGLHLIKPGVTVQPVVVAAEPEESESEPKEPGK